KHQQNAVLDGESKQPALIGSRHSSSGNGYGDTLNRYHFPHHTCRRLYGCGQHRVEAECIGGHDLKISKKRIGGSITSSEEYSKPADKSAKEGEKFSGSRQ